MIRGRIEREIHIEAPPGIVWDVITQPQHINSWFTDSVDLTPEPGSIGSFTWIDKDAGKHTTVAVCVERIDAPRYFAFRWNFPKGEHPTPRNSLLVEFTLTPDAGGTRLHLVESGIHDLDRPDHEKAAYVKEHSAGWDVILPRLPEYLSTRFRTART